VIYERIFDTQIKYSLVVTVIYHLPEMAERRINYYYNIDGIENLLNERPKCVMCGGTCQQTMLSVPE
jgi:hypothetical protein